MGIPGRKPVPAEKLDPGERKRSKRELQERADAEAKLVTTDSLSCPKYLTDEAKKEWRRVMALYRKMGAKILSDLDRSALAMYCESWAIYRTAQTRWAEYKQVVSASPESQRVLDKLVHTMNDQTKILANLSEQLCLTPVGRARMGLNPARDAEPDPLTALFDTKKPPN